MRSPGQALPAGWRNIARMIKGAVRGVGLAAAVAAVLGAAAGATGQQPTFRSNVELVTIDVVATRADGARLVT